MDTTTEIQRKDPVIRAPNGKLYRLSSSREVIEISGAEFAPRARAGRITPRASGARITPRGHGERITPRALGERITPRTAAAPTPH